MKRVTDDEAKDAVFFKLMHGAKRGCVEEVEEALADEMFDPNFAHPIYPIGEAAFGGHAEVVRILLADGRLDPFNAIAYASLIGNLEILQMLLEDPRCNPAESNNLALRWAAEKGHLLVVFVLLKDPRVDPSDWDNVAVRCAASDPSFKDVLCSLLKDPRVDGSRAIWRVHRELCPLLIEDERCGIHVNRRLFEEFQPRAVREYDALQKEKKESVCAALWCMKEIGMGWKDLQEPAGERMFASALVWGLRFYEN